MDNPAGQRSPWSCDSSSSGCGRPTLRGAHPGSSRNSKCWASMSQNPPSSGTNQAPQTALPELENLSRAACSRTRLDRFFRRAYGHFEGPICIGRLGSRSAPDRPFQRHGTSNGSMDGAAAYRGVSLRYRPALSVARWRWKLWPAGSTKNSVFWYERSHHCAGVTMAESLCRTSDRQYPTGASGSRCRP